MIRVSSFITYFMLGLITLTNAQYQEKNLTDSGLLRNTESKETLMFGNITSNRDSIKLIIGFWSNYIIGYGPEYKTMNINLDKRGNFRITLPSLDHQYRISIVDAFSNNVLFNEQQIINPGDSICLKGFIRDQDEMSPLNFTGSFSGRGSAKFNCIQALKVINDDRINDITIDLAKKVSIADSVLRKKNDILNAYQTQVDSATLQLVKADFTGDICQSVLFSSFFDILGSKSSPNLAADKRKLFLDFTSRQPVVGNDILALSYTFPRYLYLKEKIKLILDHGGRNFSFKDLYLNLKNKYSGAIRERLIANYLLNNLEISEFFEGCDPIEYSFCVRDAYTLIDSDSLKTPIKNLLDSRVKGADAFNFGLLADSSNNIVKLSSFKGKVVLVDIWSYICTGCYRFANTFHDKLFPIFKDDPNFKVVSIMLDKFADKEKYVKRLRGVDKPIYTYPDYVNLFGGKEDVMARKIEEYYNINAFPFILLIDKRGKIYSSTIPFFSEKNSPNIEKLKELIMQALAEPAL